MVKSQLAENPINVRELMNYSLTPVPPCFETPGGFISKTNKAAMMHCLLKEYPHEVDYPQDAFHIEDGNGTVHALKETPATFGGICLKLLDHMAPKNNFLFSTDSCDDHSPKSLERIR